MPRIFERAGNPGGPNTDAVCFLWLPDAIRLAFAVGEKASVPRWVETARELVEVESSRRVRAVARPV